MSNYANFINLITNLTNRLNSIESNSKKTEELPVQTVLDPASKLRVSRGGTSEQISVGNIIDAIENQNFNQLLSVGEITANPSSILIEASTTAVINRVNYGVYTDTTIPVELCDPGLRRKDILIITTSNVIVSISGEQTNGPIVLAPPTPIDSVFITDFDVTDSAIGTRTDPITGTQFVKKSYGQPFLFSGSGSDAIIPLDPLGKSEIRLKNPALVSIAGFDLSLITGVTGAEVPYNGKPYIIRNLTGNDITIKNESPAADHPFYLSGGGDLVFPNGQAIYALYDVAGFSEIFKSWSASGSDIIEVANLAALPATGEASKIYITIDTNLQYRWTGSAYVQIGGLGKKIDKITYTHTSINIINVLNTWFRFYKTQGWNNNVINANSETGSTPNLIFTNGSSRPILPNSKLVRCVLSFSHASTATPSSFEVYVGTSEFVEGTVNNLGGTNQQTLVLQTVDFTSSTAMDLIKNLTINTHSTLPFNKLYFAVREKANTKTYSFQLDFYFEEQ